MVGSGADDRGQSIAEEIRLEHGAEGPVGDGLKPDVGREPCGEPPKVREFEPRAGDDPTETAEILLPAVGARNGSRSVIDETQS